MEQTLAERRRDEILGAAIKVFSRKGYHGAKIEDIAAELNIGHGTFYRYFKNKLDIFNRVLEEIISMAAELVQDVDPFQPRDREEYRRQLEEIGDRLFGLFKARPEFSRILFYEAFGISDPELRKRIREVFDLFGSYTELYLKNGVEKGYLREGMHVKETALAVNAALFEACKRVVLSDDPDRALEIWKETIISLLLGGLSGEGDGAR
ncbi:MAG: TetR/AcrR family transcriptional regulator [Actinobacteria bacterium]|nr:TetR/AcrR family transcriptional regulator [Actinomycetota bacterium]